MVYCKNRAKGGFRYPSRKEPASALQEPVRQFRKYGLTPAFSHSSFEEKKEKAEKKLPSVHALPG